MQKKQDTGQFMELTSGSVKKQLVLFSIPIFLSTLLQQLYNVIDAVVAGRLVNEDALSAIGVSVPIYLLFVSVILGLAIGITILLAQFFGAIMAKTLLQITQTPTELLELASVITAVLSAILLFWGKGILGLIIGDNEEMILSGFSYFCICLWFYPINALIYGLGGVLSGVGDTLIAGIHSLASILVKLLVTILLIGKLELLSIAISACLGWCVASVIVVARYSGNKWQSKAVVKPIQN